MSPTDEHPVNAVSLVHAVEFCRALSKDELPSDTPEELQYRPPTEPEWERACRAGTNSPTHYGDPLLLWRNYAFYGSVKGVPYRVFEPVSTRKPNDLGLFGLCGNVHEWCFDPNVPITDREIALKDINEDGDELRQLPMRYLRGASAYKSIPEQHRPFRHQYSPSFPSVDNGLRIQRRLTRSN